jgi:putative redox protein
VSASDSTTGAPTPAGPKATPVISRTEVTWRGERLFDAGPLGRTHRIDAGAKEAPGPVEALLGAIAACSAVDIVDIIAKRRTPVERLVVSVAGERRPEAPRRLIRLAMDYKIDGAGIERDHAERAVQLSFEKYCSVAGSLASDIAVEGVVTLNGEKGTPFALKIWTPHAG